MSILLKFWPFYWKILKRKSSNYFTNQDILLCCGDGDFYSCNFFFCFLINPNILFNDIHRLAIQAKCWNASSTIYACTDILQYWPFQFIFESMNIFHMNKLFKHNNKYGTKKIVIDWKYANFTLLLLYSGQGSRKLAAGVDLCFSRGSSWLKRDVDRSIGQKPWILKKVFLVLVPI